MEHCRQTLDRASDAEVLLSKAMLSERLQDIIKQQEEVGIHACVWGVRTD